LRRMDHLVSGRPSGEKEMGCRQSIYLFGHVLNRGQVPVGFCGCGQEGPGDQNLSIALRHGLGVLLAQLLQPGCTLG
jgi:hypothetical protein